MLVCHNLATESLSARLRGHRVAIARHPYLTRSSPRSAAAASAASATASWTRHRNNLFQLPWREPKKGGEGALALSPHSL